MKETPGEHSFPPEKSHLSLTKEEIKALWRRARGFSVWEFWWHMGVSDRLES